MASNLLHTSIHSLVISTIVSYKLFSVFILLVWYDGTCDVMSMVLSAPHLPCQQTAGGVPAVKSQSPVQNYCSFNSLIPLVSLHELCFVIPLLSVMFTSALSQASQLSLWWSVECGPAQPVVVGRMWPSSACGCWYSVASRTRGGQSCVL